MNNVQTVIDRLLKTNYESVSVVHGVVNHVWVMICARIAKAARVMTYYD